MYSREQLADIARTTLQNNDRGGYTLPTAGLYPFQWNWDAGITALGWMTFDEARAWKEFETLFSGQWGADDLGGQNAGFLAQITFHQDSDSYFPGPDQWGTDDLKVRTSSISQPPLHATMMRWMFDRSSQGPSRELALARLEILVPKLLEHHRWWYRCRDPEQTGLVINIHPWETGMDNSPAWDAPLRTVPETTRPYERKDLNHVDASMRPPKAFYDRMVYLMDFNRSVGFDPASIYAGCPYRVNDIGIISILQRASRDLVYLCQVLHMDTPVHELQMHVNRTQLAVRDLWSHRWRQYVSRNAITGELLEVPTSAGLLAAYAGFENDCAGTIANWLMETPYGLPSTRMTASGFESRRYWRGPIWQHINMLISEGLATRGRAEIADRIAHHSRTLLEATGFHEYYNPLSGSGLGGSEFSWTAATYLHWLHPANR
jgi:hypothetical protein